MGHNGRELILRRWRYRLELAAPSGSESINLHAIEAVLLPVFLGPRPR